MHASDPQPRNRNTGHGHVRPRPDGVTARCGGPGICKACSAEAATFDDLVPRYAGCNPATCSNGKCAATGRCVDQQLDKLETRHPTLTPVTVGRTLIAFTGLAGSGKSTAALHLVNAHGYQRMRFAGPLKAMMAALGLTPAQIDGQLKETPCDLLGGRTPRYAMQTIGTEWGRDLIAPDLWIRAWQAALPATGRIVVDDCRFPNEAAAIKAAGGLLVRIVRPGAGAGAAGHASEAQDLPCDFEIKNDRDLVTFLGAVTYIFCV